MLLNEVDVRSLKDELRQTKLQLMKALRETTEEKLELVYRTLSLAKVLFSGSQKNVLPDGATTVRSATCGLYVYGKNVGMSRYSIQHPRLTKLLCLFQASAG